MSRVFLEIKGLEGRSPQTPATTQETPVKCAAGRGPLPLITHLHSQHNANKITSAVTQKEKPYQLCNGSKY